MKIVVSDTLGTETWRFMSTTHIKYHLNHTRTHFCNKSNIYITHWWKWNIHREPLWQPRHKTSFLTCCSQRAVHLPWHGVSVVPQLDRTAKVPELNQSRRCQKDVRSWYLKKNGDKFNIGGRRIRLKANKENNFNNYKKEHETLTLNIPVDNAMLMEDIDGCSDLFTIEPDDMFLQPQSGHLLQSALIAVLHEDVHLLLQVSTWKLL